jgi:hypothetical protein
MELTSSNVTQSSEPHRIKQILITVLYAICAVCLQSIYCNMQHTWTLTSIRCTINIVNYCSYMFQPQDEAIFRHLQTSQMHKAYTASVHTKRIRQLPFMWLPVIQVVCLRAHYHNLVKGIPEMIFVAKQTTYPNAKFNDRQELTCLRLTVVHFGSCSIFYKFPYLNFCGTKIFNCGGHEDFYTWCAQGKYVTVWTAI